MIRSTGLQFDPEVRPARLIVTVGHFVSPVNVFFFVSSLSFPGQSTVFVFRGQRVSTDGVHLGTTNDVTSKVWAKRIESRIS
jgi:hypothetical protein